MTEPPFTDEEMFERYCGSNLGRKICVVTTHWDRIERGLGAQREKEIKDNYCATGTTMARFLHTRESAWDVVETLLEASTKADAAKATEQGVSAPVWDGQ